MRLYVLDAGDMTCTNASYLSDQYAPQSSIPLANPVFLIVHPQGTILWDTGLSDKIAEHKDGMQNWIFHLRLKRTLKSQLKELGIKPEDIDYLAFSHMHIDHTGNANYFPSATLVMQKKEYDTAFHAAKKPMNYEDYKELEKSAVIKLKGDRDFFGDGRITFISTPGHTEGHQSLMLRLEREGTIIIAGDISYTMDHYLREGIPSFNYDEGKSLRSIHKIRKMAEQQNAQLWIQHDKGQFDLLKIAPQFYH